MSAGMVLAALNVVRANENERAVKLHATPSATISKIGILEDFIRQHPQTDIETEHVFHAGMYTRTVRLPQPKQGEATIFTSVLIKRPTMVIVNGVCDVLIDDIGVRLTGYNVVACDAGRKQVYIAHTKLEITMFFPTDAKTVEQAEAEFTDEADNLLSRKVIP